MLLKLFSSLHLLSVIPIICYVVRIQLFGTFFYNPYPSKIHVTVYAFIVLGMAIFVLYVAYDSLGSLLGIIGATFGFILMYFVPIIINIIYYRRKHPPLDIIKGIEATASNENKNNENNHISSESINRTSNDYSPNETNKGTIVVESDDTNNINSFGKDKDSKINDKYIEGDSKLSEHANNEDTSIKVSLDDKYDNELAHKKNLINEFQKQFTDNKDLELKDRYIYTGKKRSITKDYCFYFAQYLMLAVGLITVVFQFITINVFNVVIEK